MVENVQNVTCCLICILQRQIWNTIKTLLPVVASWCFICWMCSACFNAHDAQLFFSFFFFLPGSSFEWGAGKVPLTSYVSGWRLSRSQSGACDCFKRRVPSPCLWIRRPVWGWESLKRSRGQQDSSTATLLGAPSFSSPLSLSVMHSYLWMLNRRKVFDFPAVTWFNGLRGLTEISRGQPCILSGKR